METLKHYFQQFAPIKDNEWEFFVSKLEKKEYYKKEIITPLGSQENYLWFIEKGCVRYYVPGGKNETTFFFNFKNEIMCAFSSFIKREPTTYVVQTMGPMTAWRIHYDDLQEVYEKTEDANLMSRLVLEKQYASKIAREKSILELTPEKRYLQLLAERSTILDEIPLKYVASYIGITPEALSRIRKRLSS